MARPPIWPPRIHRHSSGQARVAYRGREYYLGRYGSPQAQKAYAELLVRLSEQPEEPPKPAKRDRPISVARVAADWLDGPGRRQSSREIVQYRHAIGVLVRAAGEQLAADFDARSLRRVRDEMIRLRWCAGVCNRQIVRIRTVWRWVEAEGLTPRGSWEHLRTLRGLGPRDRDVVHRPPVQPVSWAELVAVVRACRRRQLKAMLLLQWFAGLRPGEVCQMRAVDIDQSGPVWVYRPATHKNAWRGQERAIALGPVCQKILSNGRWLERKPCLFRPAPHKGEAAPHYSGESYAQAVRRAAARAGVPDFHPYRIRHAARLRISRALGLEAARAMLGHTSLGTTNRYAAGVDLDLASQVASQVG